MNTIKSPYLIIRGNKIILWNSNPAKTPIMPEWYSDGYDAVTLENAEVVFNGNESITITGDRLLFHLGCVIEGKTYIKDEDVDKYETGIFYETTGWFTKVKKPYIAISALLKERDCGYKVTMNNYKIIH